MGRPRYSIRPTNETVGTPFLTAELAWLWAANAVRYDEPGAHLTANRSTLQRPCEPRDVIFLACRLRRQKVMSGLEFGTLCRFGAKDRPPDSRDESEVRDCAFWDRALSKMEPELIRKGIVATSAKTDLALTTKRTKYE